jgi:rhodanese-related sulfurtransferase
MLNQSPDAIRSITVEELSAYLTQRANGEGNPSVQLIDVREPWELETASITGFVNLPLSQMAEWAEQIAEQFDATTETIVMCHHGMRSAQFCYWLMQQGFQDVRNLTGGIAAYSSFIDPSIPQY